MAEDALGAGLPEQAVARHHLKAVVDAVLATGELDDPRWHSLAVVFSLADAGRGFGNGGYAYGESGDWWAVSFPVLGVRPAVLDYVRAIRDPVPDALSRVLLQYDKRLGKARLTAEFEHPERWTITPETARDVLTSIRPNFEATSPPPPVSHAGRLQA